jgi:plastocyanin
MRRGLTAGGLFWLLLMAPPALAANQSVTISGYAFAPATVHVDPGDAVTWTWGGPDTDTRTCTGRSWSTARHRLRRGRYGLTLSVTDADGNTADATTLKLTIR